MRTDEKLARQTFRFSPGWKQDGITGRVRPDIDRRLNGGRIENGRFIAHSLSGNERNHLFLSDQAKKFENLSVLSGLDNPADGRGFVLWDYDRDGWQDIALVNANAPLLNLYRNEISTLVTPTGEAGKMVALRFVGGNRSSGTSTFSNRDGYGALVVASLGGKILKREHRCGEGYATQNSATMILGIGERTSVPSITVRWPSGRTTTTRDVAAGTLLTAYENPHDSPTGTPFVTAPYRPARERPRPDRDLGAKRPTFPLARLHTDASDVTATTKLRVYTTVATWCAACIEHVPEMNLITSTLRDEGVQFYGVPVDVDEDPAKLQSFADRWRPPYTLLKDLSTERRRSVTEFLKTISGGQEPGIPSSILTDESGRVLLVGVGIPSISTIRKLLMNQLQ